ncbi:MAG: glycosyltransferase family 4 protein [Deltaproteobacteria bacterium]|nr:glycosyltransferase family 4 protein [Deltaproteobacteria bacterium]MBW2150045.1 glycosyltransferase family 4 protein [Deltaproteobacteria bacterium]
MKRIAFIMSTFPTLTETFVAGEIKLLISHFQGSRIYSMRRPFDKTLHLESLELMKKTVYLPPPLSIACLKSNARWLIKQPIRCLRVLLYLMIHTIYNPIHLAKTVYLLPQAAHLAELLQASNIDHLHAHWSGYPTTVALAVSKLTGLSYSFTSHACDMSMIKTLVAEKIKNALFVLTCTADALKFVRSFLPAEQINKIKVNYHGCNLQKFRSELRRPGGGSRSIIVSCADLHERKGFPCLLQALAILQRENVNFSCFIVGEGPQRPLLEKMIQTLGLQGRVMLPGAVTQEELIEKYYAVADIFVLPCMVQRLRFFRKNVDLGRLKILECKMSRGESIQKDGIPNVLVEAMAMKIPVVSSEIAAIPELIKHNQNGLLSPQKDSETLARHLILLIEDEKLRLRLGEAGCRTVHEFFDRSKNIRELLDIFSQASSLYGRLGLPKTETETKPAGKALVHSS